MAAPFKFFFILGYLVFIVTAAIKNMTYAKFYCLTTMIHAILPGDRWTDRQTNGQQNLSNRALLALLGIKL